MSNKPISQTRYFDRFRAIDRQTLFDLARKEKYFHNMRIGDYETGSWVYEKHLPPNYHLYPTFQFLNGFDINSSVCLDIGTYDGMCAFSLAKRGAARVDATCQYDLDRFRISRALLGCSTVAYYPQTDLTLIRQSFSGGQYDLVLMTAMLHHLLSPIEGLLEARRLLKRGGYLIVEALVREGGPADFKLNTALKDPVYGCPTIWISSPDGMKEILRLAGFNPVSEIHLIGGREARESNYDRVTLLAQAVSRNQISGRTPKTIEFHNQIQTIGNYSFGDFEATEINKSLLSDKHKCSSFYQLDIWSHKPQDALQPEWENTN